MVHAKIAAARAVPAAEESDASFRSSIMSGWRSLHHSTEKVEVDEEHAPHGERRRPGRREPHCGSRGSGDSSKVASGSRRGGDVVPGFRVAILCSVGAR